MFITIEGIEGSGKSTLLAGVADRLRAAGRRVLTTREPGGTLIGDAIRQLFLEPGSQQLPMTEVLLVNASRAQLVGEVIRPALAAGETVLCDRYTDSTLAYQGFGRGLDLGALQAICDTATGQLIPDVTFLLDVPIEVSRLRTAQRRGHVDRIEGESLAFHERVRGGFLALAAQSNRIVMLDGTAQAQTLVDEALQAIADYVA